MMNQNKNHLRSPILKLVFSAMFVALGMVLPFLTGQVPQIGSMLCPMHIPVLLCGYVCGAPWGLVTGFILPILRSATLGMPPMFPTAMAMAFELAAYGAFSGLLYRRLPQKVPYLYVSLVGAMLIGRIVWGVASVAIHGAMGTMFLWPAFVAGAFTNAIPGMVLQLILIPVLVIALKRARLMPEAVGVRADRS